MLLQQQALQRQKLLVLGSLAVGSLLYLVVRVGSLDRLQPSCPLDGSLRPPDAGQILLRSLQFKRGLLLHELRKGNGTPEQVHLRDPEQAHLRDPEQAHLRDPEQAHLRDPEQAHLRDPEQAHLRDPEQAHLRDPEQVHLRDPEQAHLRDPEQAHLRDPEQAHLRDPEQAHLHAPVQQLPRALIVGVRKGGTRALLEMLNLHPAVVKASQEIHFFDNDQNYARGIDWYRGKMPFSFPHQITIEKSPAYFITEEVPERIFKMNSSIKLLVIVREPTTRAVSDYTQVLEGKERKNKTYHKFEELAVDEATCEVNTKYKAVRTSIYSHHLERWLHFFPTEQLHVVDGDRLISDPLPELQLVERFLRLPAAISRSNLYFNATRGFYCLRFSLLFNKCLAGSKGRTHPAVDASVVEKLQRFFHPFNQKFYQITGRTFDWP